MGRYRHELWLGRATNYWNWEMKGVADDDFETRAKLCDEYIKELKVIKEYYEGLKPTPAV